MIQEPFGCTGARAFHLVLVYSHWEHLPACVIVFFFFLCLQFPYLNGNNDTLDLCCVYLISWLGRKRKRHSLLAQLLTWLFVHTQKVHWPLIWLYHAINKLFHLREKCLFLGNQLKNACAAFFGCVSGGIVAQMLVSAQEREILLLCVRPGISHGSESEGARELFWGSMLLLICVFHPCVLELPHMLSNLRVLLPPQPSNRSGRKGPFCWALRMSGEMMFAQTFI